MPCADLLCGCAGPQALALRVSMEEERARQAAAAAAAQQAGGEGAGASGAGAAAEQAAGGEAAAEDMTIDAMDEDALLQQALALSMQVDQPTPAPTSGEGSRHAPHLLPLHRCCCLRSCPPADPASPCRPCTSPCWWLACAPLCQRDRHLVRTLPCCTAGPAPTPAAPSKAAGGEAAAPTPPGPAEDQAMADLEVDDPEVGSAPQRSAPVRIAGDAEHALCSSMLAAGGSGRILIC